MSEKPGPATGCCTTKHVAIGTTVTFRSCRRTVKTRLCMHVEQEQHGRFAAQSGRPGRQRRAAAAMRRPTGRPGAPLLTTGCIPIDDGSNAAAWPTTSRLCQMHDKIVYEADPLKTLHEPCDREVIRAFILGTTRREQTCRGGRVWVPEICHRRTSCRQRLP